MRRFLYAFIVLAATLSLASAQSVTTVPVGFTTPAIPAAIDANTPSSTVISVPFYAVDATNFVGAVSSVDSSNQLSISGATFTNPNGFVTPPHLARLKSGSSVGRFFIITANTATQLTLDTATAGYALTSGTPSNTQAQVNVGDSVEIFPASTLSTLFGFTAATVPFQQGSSAGAADNMYLFNGTSWDVYFFNGTTQHWRKSGNLNNQDNTVVLPDRGIFIVRRATSPLNLTFLGTVPSTTERTDVAGAGSTFKSSRFPVDFTLAGATNPLNLQTLSNWLGGTSAGAADNVYLWEGTSWGVYFYNNTTGHWRKSGNLNNQDTKVIPLGTAMFIVRQSTAQGNTSTLVQTLPYSL
jgi:uncharacterized protein (TIGR02597 family)